MPLLRRLQMIFAATLLLVSGYLVSASAAQPDRAPATKSFAAERAAALDERFAALKGTKTEAEADAIVASIWSLWMHSGDAELDELMGRADLAMRSGDGDLAEELYDQVIARKPDYAEAWNQRATLRFYQSRYEDSLADCYEVLKREPRHFGALAGMGMIAMSQGNDRAALDALRRAHALNPFLKDRSMIPALERKVEGQPL